MDMVVDVFGALGLRIQVKLSHEGIAGVHCLQVTVALLIALSLFNWETQV
jgi:hypothetical protein